jgi:RNA polymerase sigma-70 factor (ECF subfamily)
MSVRDKQSDVLERDLVVAAQRGDRAAFKKIYERYRDRVYNLAFYSLGDALSAEDTLQIVFLKVYKALPGFRFEASISTWIYRIALNELQDQSRWRSAPLVPLEAILGSDEELGTEMPPDEGHAKSEREEIIQQAIMELSPKLRAVVVLKYLEELSYDEIAALLECSAGTVASRLNRALAALEERLRPLRRLL